MKKILVFFVFISFYLNLFATNIKIKHPLPVFYTHENITGIIEIATIDVTNEVSDLSSDLSSNLAIDKRVKKFCDYLVANGYTIPTTIEKPFGVPIQSSMTEFYSYPSWDVKITDYSGARVIEVIDEKLQNLLIKHNPVVIAGFPLKFLFFIDNAYNHKFLHICMVDPVDYIGQFTEIDNYIKSQLQIEIDKFISLIKQSFKDAPNVYIKPIYAKKVKNPTIPSIIKIAEVYSDKDINTFINSFLKAGDILTKLDNGIQVRYFPGMYDPYKYLNSDYTEITGLLSFCRFILATKNIYMDQNGMPNYSKKLPTKSEPMEFMIKNSLSHVYARYFPDNFTEEKWIKFEYTLPNGEKLYQLKYFDPYIDPPLMTTGLWHLVTVPKSIFIFKVNGIIYIFAQNPVFLIEKYFKDVSDESLEFFAEKWNNFPTSMFYWPNLTKKEMGEFTLEKLRKLIERSLIRLKVNYNIWR